jgi:hypothetical protein
VASRTFPGIACGVSSLSRGSEHGSNKMQRDCGDKMQGVGGEGGTDGARGRERAAGRDVVTKNAGGGVTRNAGGDGVTRNTVRHPIFKGLRKGGRGIGKGGGGKLRVQERGEGATIRAGSLSLSLPGCLCCGCVCNALIRPAQPPDLNPQLRIPNSSSPTSKPLTPNS